MNTSPRCPTSALLPATALARYAKLMMIVDQYAVHADLGEGACLDEAVYVGKVRLREWLEQRDTADRTYTTADVDGEVRAICIIWRPPQ